MIHFNYSKLNPLEKSIHENLTTMLVSEKNMSITEAAAQCGCSVSKISKYVRKLGFKGYKQYVAFLSGEDISSASPSGEIERLKSFLEGFDIQAVEEMIRSIDAHDKIILFGYGPSFICAQYFQYKLQLVTSKIVLCVMDEASLVNMIDERSLLIVFSATGQFRSFQNTYTITQEKNADFLFVLEEYNKEILDQFDHVLLLTQTAQAPNRSPYEKSRAIFFIFIETVIEGFLNKNAALEK